MSASQLNQVANLIATFRESLMFYEQHCPFRRPEQLELHRRTIETRMSFPSPEAAANDEGFAQLLYSTLQAWNLGVRASKLRPFPDFFNELKRAMARSRINDLQHLRIDTVDFEANDTGIRIWRLIDGLAITENEAVVVAGTKTVHHLLPNLVPPMDRAYTQLFFGWDNSKFQKCQHAFLLLEALNAFSDIARNVSPAAFVGTHAWHTSRAKVLDNGLVGFIEEIKVRIEQRRASVH